MTNNISKRDWETISAYLDGQLSQRKKARLESRLYNDRQFQAALGELRDTRLVLRSAPKLRAPHNFMLTPEMAGNPIRMPRLAPVFGWASAVVSFLLVLVLVGDFFGGIGYVSSAFTASQQNEFVAQHSQTAESDVLAQPAVSEDLGVSLKGSVGSAEQAAPPEMQDDLAPMDLAAEPSLELAPVEEVLPDQQEIEMSAVSEEPTPEILEGRAAVTTQGDATFAAPLEALSEGNDEGSGEVVQDTDYSADSTAAPESVETESVQQQPTEMPVAEEIPIQTLEEQSNLLSIAVAETPPLADAKALQVEQPPANVAENSISVEPTIVVAFNEVETTSSETSFTPKTRDMVFGIEVILALGALGTGLAWLYIRRRGG